MVAAVQFSVPGSVRLKDVSRPAKGESPAQRLWRLASKGQIEGCRVLRVVGADGMFVVTSASSPDTAYAVDTADRSCSCEGFGRHQMCKHVALVLAALGELPEPEPPTPAAPLAVDCPACDGAGFTKHWTGARLADWTAEPCRTCRPAA